MKELKGVVALVPEQVMVGAVVKSAALVGAMPDPYHRRRSPTVCPHTSNAS
jgi:hypothetical protein